MDKCEGCPTWKICTEECAETQVVRNMTSLKAEFWFILGNKAYYSLVNETGRTIRSYFCVDASGKVEPVAKEVMAAGLHYTKHKEKEGK